MTRNWQEQGELRGRHSYQHAGENSSRRGWARSCICGQLTDVGARWSWVAPFTRVGVGAGCRWGHVSSAGLPVLFSTRKCVQKERRGQTPTCKCFHLHHFC